MKTMPDNLTIFVSVTLNAPDGKTYGVEFLAKDWEHARKICEWCGLADDNRLGTLEACGEVTPDGPMTTWDKDE